MAKLAGWVEHSEIHLPIRGKAMGFAKRLNRILRAASMLTERQAGLVH
jgi:hypothetical protein